ncbi:hypothetical protein BT96DRAFT_918935 [Gymnopus androsaceus JB14]|uniref:P-loop containing nucleoside triphosphate hydrolase protein n=1 Tax=Gymnopus androsaceus JB14 TaxID=1447944 RepID=A0A6A4HW89_9AGAR|nr:hypothetical protein BT96DRAFT_918935 [Gymnopus androsaceus JB14]
MAFFCSNDSTFGPRSQCRPFDFTIVFEFSVLSLLPSLLFGLYTGYKILCRPRFNAKSSYTPIDIIKTAVILLDVSCHLLALVSWVVLAHSSMHLAQKVVLAAILANLVTSIITAILILGFRDNSKHPFGHSLCLLVIILLSTTQVRTFVSMRSQLSVFFLVTFLGGYCTRVLVLITLNLLVTDGKFLAPSPETAGIISRLFILWALPMIWKGRHANLQIDDLEELHTSLSSTALFQMLKTSWNHPKTVVDDKPRLDKALIHAFLPYILSPVLPGLVRAVGQGLQPLLVLASLKFIQSYSSGAKPQPAEYGFALVGAFALVYFSLSASSALYYTAVFRTATQLRAALIQAIYRKTIHLSAGSVTNPDGHHPVNLISSDVEQIVTHIDPLHQIWISCIVLVIGVVILYTQIRVSFVSTVIVIIVILILLPWLSRPISARSARSSVIVDYRIRLIFGIINQIRGIKLNGYEPELLTKIGDTRKRETAAKRHTWVQWGKIVALTSITSNMLSLATLGTYAIVSLYSTGIDALGTSRLFTVYTVMSVIAAPLLQAGQYWPGVVEAYQSIERIGIYLRYAESHHRPSSAHLSLSVHDKEGESGFFSKGHLLEDPVDSEVVFDNATIGWGEKIVLQNLNLRIALNRCTMIIGRVASGKSTLLATLLGESTVLSGGVTYPWACSTISYCSQKPWIQSSRSLAENILFVSPMDPDWYKVVVEACALDADFANMVEGDQSSANKLSGGQQARIALARALYARNDIFILDDPLSALDGHTSVHVFNALFGPQGLLQGKTVVLSTNHAPHLQAADVIVEINSETGITSYSSSSGKTPWPSSITTGKDETGTQNVNTLEVKEALDHEIDDSGIEVVNSGAIGFRTYAHYSGAAGYHRIAIYFLSLLLAVTLQTTTPVYLQFWSSYNDRHQTANADLSTQKATLGKYLGGYAAFEGLFSIAVSANFFYTMLVVIPHASINLHASALSAVLASPLGFFTATPTGQIISRFSQDISLIDSYFPIAMYDLTYQGLGIIGSIVLLVIAVPYLIIVVVIVALVCYLVQKLYIATSRQLRRLDLASNSPLYTLMSETLTIDGLFTIRAAGAQEALINRSTYLLSASQRTFHYNNVTRTWLNTVIATLTAIINTFVMLIAVLGRHSTQTVSLQESVNLLLVSLAAAEVSAVAVERNLQYTQLTPEESMSEAMQHSSANGWSAMGDINFDKVTARYDGHDNPVLQEVSFRIPSGTHTALCGRTGSGKSTGFDGQVTSSIALQDLRNNIAIVTQDPFVLDSTLRENLNVFGKLTDEEIWSALEAVQLKNTTLSFKDKLDQKLSSSGTDFSRGQMQLLALARALLRKNKIVILDEATANLDMQTDRMIQEVIRSAFKDVTVVTIAHRIYTIADYDQVIVLDHGRVVELGRPVDMLANTDGPLAQLFSHSSS